MRVGLRTKRINLANGYDLYRPQAYPDLTKLALVSTSARLGEFSPYDME